MFHLQERQSFSSQVMMRQSERDQAQEQTQILKKKLRKVFEDNKEVYVNLAFTSEITVQQGKAGIGDDAVSVVIPDAVAYLPLEDLVDFEKEKERLNKEKDKLTKELARSRGMLSNEKFLNNAKPEKVQEEKDKLAKYEQMMAQVEERLAQFK